MRETELNEAGESRHDYAVERTADERTARATTETGATERGSAAGTNRTSGAVAAPSRRALLAAVGTGVMTGVGGLATGFGAAQSETASERRYVECDRVLIPYSQFPDAVQGELDQALESGAYEADRLRLPETMAVEGSYVVIDDTAYTPVIERTDDGASVLTLEAVENPTLGEVRSLDVHNESEASQTLSVRIADPDGDDETEVLFEGTITVGANEERTIWETDVIGTYDLTIETEDGQHVEDTFYAVEHSFTSLEIEVNGDVAVYHAEVPLEQCRFGPEDHVVPWVEPEVETERLAPGEHTTAHLLLTYTSEGLAEYDLEVTVADPDVARLTGVQYDEAFDAGEEPTIASDGSSATLRAVDTNEAVPSDTRFVPLATVELEAADDVDAGTAIETSLEVVVESMIDDDGSAVDAGDEPATLTVENRGVDATVGAGIDQYAYSRDSRGLGQGERDSPQVTIGDDTVVVHGSSTTGPSVCSGEELRELAFDEADGTLAVTVSGPNDPDYESQGCTADEAAVSYELVAVLEEGTPETVTLTERAYARSGTVTVDREDGYPGVSGVEDVEFGLVDDRDIHDAETDPEVTIDGGTVVVSGTIELSAIACQTVEPALIAYDEGWGRLVVEVRDALAEGVDPDDPCPGAAGAQGYELRVPVDVDSLSRVNVVEPTVTGDRLVTVDGGDLEETTSELELNGYTPQDLDGDGLYRDVDGNGDAGTNDVVVVFENVEDPAVTEHAEYYDFDGNGQVSITDVIDLFDRL